MRLLLDTNIFLEILLAQEKAEEARYLLSRTGEYEFFVTDYTVHSIGLLLFRRNQHEVFLRFIRDVLVQAGTRVLTLPVENMEDLIRIAREFNLDFDDAYQYKVAEKYALTLVSFDSDFDHTPKGRRRPASLL